MPIRRGWMLLAALALGLSAVAACDDDGDENGNGNGNGKTDGGVKLNQNQAVAWLLEANSGVVEIGQIAQVRGQREDVRALALIEVQEHQASNVQLITDAQAAGVVLQDSAPRRELNDQFEREVGSLLTVPSSSFDSRYINFDILTHQQQLAAIDAVIVPAI
ncbi:MAG: DUF4142 domain-containing protein, partial [Polyangiaceae bacterium]|nr:DUF4142 domain-containing protein [Polyangiaceae bacterium]